jgi:nicotinamide-nucleotide amidase
MLGIQSSTLNKFGAVSEDIAREMVAGALKFSEAQLAVSVTGIAGPGGGSDDKPVGTVCFGFALKGKTASEKIWTEKKWFNGEREQVREASLLFVLNRLNEVIISN